MRQADEDNLGDAEGHADTAASTTNLVVAWPELLTGVPAADRRLAERALMVPLISVRDQDLGEATHRHAPEAFGFLIIEGVVLKETALRRRSALELLGPGDLLAPPLAAGRQLESRAVSQYLAHGPVSLAVIGDRVRAVVRHWPGIADALHDRLGRQTHRASMHLAMLHLPRIEDRITALFADLAERFGRMNSDEILIDPPLTHELIGGLVGGRRPTVTLALHKLAADGVLHRLDDGRWRLAGQTVSLSPNSCNRGAVGSRARRPTRRDGERSEVR